MRQTLVGVIPTMLNHEKMLLQTPKHQTEAGRHHPRTSAKIRESLVVTQGSLSIREKLLDVSSR